MTRAFATAHVCMHAMETAAAALLFRLAAPTGCRSELQEHMFCLQQCSVYCTSAGSHGLQCAQRQLQQTTYSAHKTHIAGWGISTLPLVGCAWRLEAGGLGLQCSTHRTNTHKPHTGWATLTCPCWAAPGGWRWRSSSVCGLTRRTGPATQVGGRPPVSALHTAVLGCHFLPGMRCTTQFSSY